MFLQLLIGFAACRAGDMEMIESYLDQMMARVGYSVNYALDQAFSETDGSDWEIYELKKDVIDQAQSMFRPLAQSVLVESFRPRLQKRGDLFSDEEKSLGNDLHHQFVYGVPEIQAYSSIRYDPDFEAPNGRIPFPFSGLTSFKDLHTEIRRNLHMTNSDRSPNSLFADNPFTFGDPSHDYPPDPLSHQSNLLPSIDNFRKRKHRPAKKNSFEDLLKYDHRSYRPEWFQENEYSNADYFLSPEKSLNMKFVQKVRQIFARLGRAWKNVLSKLNLGKVIDSFGNRFAEFVWSDVAHKTGLLVLGMGIGYLVYALLFREDNDHEYFD